MPETLNPDALPRREENQVITSTATGATEDQLIGISVARDGAVYRTTKKKLKQGRQAAAPSGAWKNY